MNHFHYFLLLVVAGPMPHLTPAMPQPHALDETVKKPCLYCCGEPKPLSALNHSKICYLWFTYVFTILSIYCLSLLINSMSVGLVSWMRLQIPLSCELLSGNDRASFVSVSPVFHWVTGMQQAHSRYSGSICQTDPDGEDSAVSILLLRGSPIARNWESPTQLQNWITSNS